MFDEMRAKWDGAERGIKVAVVVAGLLVGALLLVKILPALAAGAGIGTLLAILFLPYWAPTIVAFVRKHPSRGGIFALNFFLGWTFIGWVVAIIWALSDNTGRVAQVIVTNEVSPSISVTAAVGSPPPPPVSSYQIGDVVNGHRFDGASWVPVTSATAHGAIAQ